MGLWIDGVLYENTGGQYVQNYSIGFWYPISQVHVCRSELKTCEFEIVIAGPFSGNSHGN